jgi:maltose alpha-D-glucosyltransferase/alpha-amylase
MAPYLASAGLLGRRVAELHLALVSTSDDPDFAPEPFTTLYRRSAYQSMRNLLTELMRTIEGRNFTAPGELREQMLALAAHQGEIVAPFDAFLACRVSVMRMRCHGDLHLGQVLNTGKDFVIIDFEGEPARPLSERRHKRAALRDVAGMLRSFHYAAFTAMMEELKGGALGKVEFARLEPWANFWQAWSSWSFLSGYLDAAGTAPFVPKTTEELRILLDAFVMEKAIYELGYELNNRPDWAVVPMRAISQSIGLSTPAPATKQ